MKIVHLDAVKIDCTAILCDECQDLNAHVLQNISGALPLSMTALCFVNQDQSDKPHYQHKIYLQYVGQEIGSEQVQHNNKNEQQKTNRTELHKRPCDKTNFGDQEQTNEQDV